MERRIRTLEKLIAQQGYVIHALLIVTIVDTAALLLLWMENGKPNYDHIAVSLSAFQIMFAIAAIYGFWTLRGSVRERAEEVAEAEVQKIAPPLIRRITLDTLSAYPEKDTISESDLDDMVDAIGDGEAGDGERT